MRRIWIDEWADFISPTSKEPDMSNTDTTFTTTRREVEALRAFVLAYDAMEEAVNADPEVPADVYDEVATRLCEARMALDEFTLQQADGD